MKTTTEPQARSLEELLSVDDVAERIGVSTAWVRAHANGSRLPLLESAKMGKFRRFRPEHVEAFIRQCEAIARDQATRRNG